MQLAGPNAGRGGALLRLTMLLLQTVHYEWVQQHRAALDQPALPAVARVAHIAEFAYSAAALADAQRLAPPAAAAAAPVTVSQVVKLGFWCEFLCGLHWGASEVAHMCCTAAAAAAVATQSLQREGSLKSCSGREEQQQVRQS